MRWSELKLRFPHEWCAGASGYELRREVLAWFEGELADAAGLVSAARFDAFVARRAAEAHAAARGGWNDADESDAYSAFPICETRIPAPVPGEPLSWGTATTHLQFR